MWAGVCFVVLLAGIVLLFSPACVVVFDRAHCCPT